MVKPKEMFKVQDLALGKCPECDQSTTFTPTINKNIYICDWCDKEVYQHKNGKVHWYTLQEMPLMGVKPHKLSDK